MSRKFYCGCLCHHPIPTGGIICHCDCRDALLAITPYNQEQARKIKALEEENAKLKAENEQCKELFEKIEQLKAQLQQAKCLHCCGEGKITVSGNRYVYPVDIPCPECKLQHCEVSGTKLNSKPERKPIGITDDGHYVYALEPRQCNQ